MIETLSQNPLSLVLIFPVVTLTVFVVGIIRIDLAKFQQKHTNGHAHARHHRKQAKGSPKVGFQLQFAANICWQNAVSIKRHC